MSDRRMGVEREAVGHAVIRYYGETAAREGRRADLIVLAGHELWEYLLAHRDEGPDAVWMYTGPGARALFCYDAQVVPVDPPLAPLRGWRLIRSLVISAGGAEGAVAGG